MRSPHPLCLLLGGIEWRSSQRKNGFTSLAHTVSVLQVLSKKNRHYFPQCRFFILLSFYFNFASRLSRRITIKLYSLVSSLQQLHWPAVSFGLNTKLSFSDYGVGSTDYFWSLRHFCTTPKEPPVSLASWRNPISQSKHKNLNKMRF